LVEGSSSTTRILLRTENAIVLLVLAGEKGVLVVIVSKSWLIPAKKVVVLRLLGKKSALVLVRSSTSPRIIEWLLLVSKSIHVGGPTKEVA